MSSSNCGLIRLPRRYNQHQVFLSNQYHKSSRLPNTFFQILLLQPTKRDSSTILKKDLFKSFTTSAKIKITCIANCFVNPPRHLDPQIITIPRPPFPAPVYISWPWPTILLPIQGLTLHIPTLSPQSILVFTSMADDLPYHSGV